MDTLQTITPKQVIAYVQELAAADYGPIGVVNFDFIPLADDVGVRANWDLVFRPAPSDLLSQSDRRARAIQRAIAEVRALYPRVRWP